MITEAVLSVFGALLSFIVGLMPDWTPPTWVTDATGWLATTLEVAPAFAWFLPIVAIAHCFGVLLVVQAVIWGVRVFRIVVSLLTGGGGSVA